MRQSISFHGTVLSVSVIASLAMGLASCEPADDSAAVSEDANIETANTGVVKKIYADFEAGNIDSFVAALDPDMIWNEAENNLYAPDSPYVGVPTIMEGVFAPLMAEWEYFNVKPEIFLADGDQVAMFGRYEAKYTATGQTMNPQVVHRWTLKDGKVTAFQQHMDTLAQMETMGLNRPANP